MGRDDLDPVGETGHPQQNGVYGGGIQASLRISHGRPARRWMPSSCQVRSPTKA
ncbi:hypothetical protein L083_3348 [Actinoplanes sp. N902-109]|nr:hypothetical protein L083_3348 [Actinoplanes sp. N902-109]